MSENIFIIKNEYDGSIKYYNHLEKAKTELIKIYEKTNDFKQYCYEINLYNLVDNEYIITNVSYTYNFGYFSTKISS